VSPLLQHVEQRMAAQLEQFGRRRHQLAPRFPVPRDNRLRAAVFKSLRLPTGVEARVASKEAFARGEGSYASLLVCRTSACVEAFLFEGVPGIRAALIDLAAFALEVADSLEPSTSTPPRSTP